MSRVVYDSELGRTCPDCGRPAGACACSRERPVAGDGIVRVRREVRRGKDVTVVLGLPLTGPALRELASALKRACSAGGGVKDGGLELQGDHRDAVITALRARGYQVRAAGG